MIPYTLLFALASVLAFRYFPAEGKRMIWRQDGLSQHYVALCYYARWGRAVLRSFLSGHPSVPTFNLHIGFGADLFTTFQYYVIGDPFSLPAVFVPQKYMLGFHDAMILLRLYLAGICFERYCRIMGHRNPAGNLCGTLVYLFGNYTLFGIRHPYFLNTLIWFPLLLLGAEQILRGKRGRLFTAAVFLSCISNFYFFYMLVLLTVLYVVWRALRLEVLSGNPVPGAWRRIGRLAARFFSRGLLGTAMGMGLFWPVVLRFLRDPRSSGSVVIPVFYSKEYYAGMAETFLSYGTKSALENWTCMGFGAVGLLGVLTLFLEREEKHPDLKAAWCGMLAMHLIPAAGAVMNGFTYPANRWGWAFTLLCAYIAAVMTPRIAKLPPLRMAALFLCLGLYAAVCRAAGAPSLTMQEILLAAAAVPAACTAQAAARFLRERMLWTRRLRTALRGFPLVCAAVLTVAMHGYECFERGVSFSHSDIRNYSTDLYVAGMMASDAAGLRQLVGPVTGNTFYRYSARSLTNNYSVLHDVSNTQYFWSLSDGQIAQFFTQTGQTNGSLDLYDNLDNRTMLDEIAGVRYYKRSDGSLLPFGYEKMEGMKYDSRNSFSREKLEKEGDSFPEFRFALHENRYALPLGFTSGRCFSRTDWEALSLPRRQEALMQGIVLEDREASELRENGKAAEAEPVFTEKEIAYSMRTKGAVRVLPAEAGGVRLLVLSEDAEIVLEMETPEETAGCETSLLFSDMDYAALTKEEEQEAGGAGEKTLAQMQAYNTSQPVKIFVKARRNGETVSEKSVEYALPDNPWNTGRNDFLSCCGYSDTALEQVRLQFSRTGTYSFREMKLVCQPMDSYPDRAEALRACVLEDLDLHELTGSGATSRITGRITVPGEGTEGEGSRILCIQIPRCSGLRAYVDGKKTPLLQADLMFCGLVLDPGTHEIELRYRTPGLAAGMAVSAAAAAVFLAEGLRSRRRGRGRGTASRRVK